MKIFVVFLFMLSTVACISSKRVLQDNKDSFSNKIKYDVENIKYLELTYANNELISSNYYTRCGNIISLYDWEIDVSIIKKIKEYILRNFVIDEFTEASGSAVLLLILDFDKNIHEIRVIRGITLGFNKELLRVTREIENDSIAIFTQNCEAPMPIITPFTIRLNKVLRQNVWVVD